MDSPPRTLPGRKGHWPPPVASEGDAVPPTFTASAQPSPRCIHGVSAKPQNSVTLAVRPSIHPSRSTWPLARTEETITQVAERRGGRQRAAGGPAARQVPAQRPRCGTARPEHGHRPTPRLRPRAVAGGLGRGSCSSGHAPVILSFRSQFTTR